MTRRLTLALLLTLPAVCQTPVAAPAAKPVAKKAPAKAATKAAVPAPAPVPLPAEDGLYAVFNTTEGRIVAKLYEKESPITVANFTGLARGTKQFTDEKTHQPARRPFFNGLTFHRVIPGFMIQGGDPLGNGMGGSGVPTIADEFDPSLKFDQPGRLAMANVGRPHTGACQFFITDGTPEHLNGRHTIFGQVVEGMDVVKTISLVPRNPSDLPLTPVIMKTVLVRRVGVDPNPPAKAPVKAPVKATPKKAAAAVK